MYPFQQRRHGTLGTSLTSCQASRTEKSTGHEDPPRIHEERADFVCGQKIEYVGRNDSIARLVVTIEPRRAVRLADFGPYAECCNALACQADHRAAHIESEVTALRTDMPGQELGCEAARTAPEFEDGTRIAEPGMRDQSFDGWTFVKGLTVLPSAETIVEAPRLVVVECARLGCTLSHLHRALLQSLLFLEISCRTICLSVRRIALERGTPVGSMNTWSISPSMRAITRVAVSSGASSRATSPRF